MAVQPPEIEQVTIITQTARSAVDYWEVLRRLVPIVIVGGSVGLCTNLAKIAHEKTWLRRLFMCVSVVSVGCVAAGASALGIELFIRNPSPEIELLVGACAGASGQKMFDIYSRRIFGLQTRYSDRRSDREIDIEETN